jgi:hypothetical protein
MRLETSWLTGDGGGGTTLRIRTVVGENGATAELTLTAAARAAMFDWLSATLSSVCTTTRWFV